MKKTLAILLELFITTLIALVIIGGVDNYIHRLIDSFTPKAVKAVQEICTERLIIDGKLAGYILSDQEPTCKNPYLIQVKQ